MICCRRLVRRIPAVVSVELKYEDVTDEGVRAVSGMRALTSLSLLHVGITNDIHEFGLRVLSTLPALTHLDLRCCDGAKVTAAGVQALRSTTAAPSLHIEGR